MEQRYAACLDRALFQTLLENPSLGIKDKIPIAYLLSSKHAQLTGWVSYYQSFSREHLLVLKMHQVKLCL